MSEDTLAGALRLVLTDPAATPAAHRLAGVLLEAVQEAGCSNEVALVGLAAAMGGLLASVTREARPDDVRALAGLVIDLERAWRDEPAAAVPAGSRH